MNKILKQNEQWINDVWEKIDKKLSKVAVKSRNKLPYTSINGIHDNQAETNAAWWTNGFWGGMMWLMYSESKNEEYMKTAVNSEKLLDKALENFGELDHDVGFLWHILSGANYRITGDKNAYNKNLFVASTLFSRFNPDGNYIRAWNWKENEGWSIIDCLMNLPLLYWASEEIGDDRFKKVAMRHADMSIRDHIRPDGSIHHIVEHDLLTGDAVNIHTGQGYDEQSCWSRGLAWAVYGMVISYRHTKEKKYLDAAVKTANYFIVNCAANDYLTLVDFKAPEEPVYYDSTAGVCAACGLIELSKLVSESEGRAYLDAAVKTLKAADENFCDYSENEDALVKMGTERYPHNEEEMRGVHIPIIYGDFFFVEAILKLRGNDFFIW